MLSSLCHIAVFSNDIMRRQLLHLPYVSQPETTVGGSGSDPETYLSENCARLASRDPDTATRNPDNYSNFAMGKQRNSSIAYANSTSQPN